MTIHEILLEVLGVWGGFKVGCVWVWVWNSPRVGGGQSPEMPTYHSYCELIPTSQAGVAWKTCHVSVIPSITLSHAHSHLVIATIPSIDRYHHVACVSE